MLSRLLICLMCGLATISAVDAQAQTASLSSAPQLVAETAVGSSGALFHRDVQTVDPANAHTSSGQSFPGGSLFTVADAQYGRLRSLSEVTITNGLLSETGVGSPIAYGDASWSDTFTVVSEVYAEGAFVVFGLSTVLHGQLITNDGTKAASPSGVLGSDYARVETWWEGFGLPGIQDYIRSTEYRYAIGYPSETYERTDTLPWSLARTITLRVGSTYSAKQVLGTYAQTSSLVFGYAGAIFGSTARFLLDPLGPGYDYTTGSGTDYHTPVAPPSSFVFSGFRLPVADPPLLNAVKAGSAVPIKFGLSGFQGLDVLASGSPTSTLIACDSVEVVDGARFETFSAGDSGLKYDETAAQYIYVWKTSKNWAGTCRQFILTLSDGNSYRANFRLH